MAVSVTPSIVRKAVVPPSRIALIIVVVRKSSRGPWHTGLIPADAKPRSRVKLAVAADSSTNTSRAGSCPPRAPLQSRRHWATSGRLCSAAWSVLSLNVSPRLVTAHCTATNMLCRFSRAFLYPSARLGSKIIRPGGIIGGAPHQRETSSSCAALRDLQVSSSGFQPAKNNIDHAITGRKKTHWSPNNPFA